MRTNLPRLFACSELRSWSGTHVLDIAVLDIQITEEEQNDALLRTEIKGNSGDCVC
jgi:hypothetical protein